MSFILQKSGRRRIAVFALVVLVPVISGCSQLGIATSDDLEATESRLQTSNRTTNSRLDTVEQSVTDTQTTMAMLTADIDTLGVRFSRAAKWLQEMNIDTISQQAHEASAAAIALEQQNRVFLAKYLEWLKAQQALIAEQIQVLDAKLQAGEDSAKGRETEASEESEQDNN